MSNRIEFLDAISEAVRLQRELECLMIDGKPASVLPGDWRSSINKTCVELDCAMNRTSIAYKEIQNSDFAGGLESSELIFPMSERKVPKKPGVYLLFNKNTYVLDYIGKSNNLRRRPFYAHQYYDREIHVVGYIVSANPSRLEAELIQLNRPRLNVIIPNIITAQGELNYEDKK